MITKKALTKKTLNKISEEVIKEGGLFANMLSHYIADNYGEETLQNYNPKDGFVQIMLQDEKITYTIVYNNKKVIDFVHWTTSDNVVFDEYAMDYAFDDIEDDIISFTEDIKKITKNANWVSFNINLRIVC